MILFSLVSRSRANISCAVFTLDWVCPSPLASREAPYSRSPSLVEGQVSGVKWRNTTSLMGIRDCYFYLIKWFNDMFNP